MKFNVLTLFPGVISCFLKEGVISKAIERSLIEINIIDIRNFSSDKHKKVDDYPFGGGDGMVMMPDPLFRAIESIEDRGRVIYMSPRGAKLNQSKVKELSRARTVTIICGRYEGVDQRVIDKFVDEELSIGDYILTGGEIPAAVIIDSVSRYIEGVLGSTDSLKEESFDDTGLVEYDHYTRPSNYSGYRVPDVLLSGNHKKIKEWRLKNRLKNTILHRLDIIIRLIEAGKLDKNYLKLLQELRKELNDERY